MIQNIDFANISGAFSSGTGDFVQLFEPTASLIEKEGKGTLPPPLERLPERCRIPPSWQRRVT